MTRRQRNLQLLGDLADVFVQMTDRQICRFALKARGIGDEETATGADYRNAIREIAAEFDDDDTIETSIKITLANDLIKILKGAEV